ncbi:Gasdermin-D [Sciurus carolinensis]|uniref:Gasdermin-D n=1 Tax=Sciurus carolinensis TaxID=30640 RepID=A0AA41STZ7_SCICA|nr:Gasdermin-D [Sciurus carolinensis]
MCFQGEGQGHLSRKNMVTNPAGSILAFQVAQLIIGSDWDLLFFPDEKQRTFPWSPTDGSLKEWTVTEDFQGLQAEAQAGSEELQHMEKKLRQRLLGDLGRVLQDPLTLQA